jgi:hypothetical protein
MLPRAGEPGRLSRAVHDGHVPAVVPEYRVLEKSHAVALRRYPEVGWGERFAEDRPDREFDAAAPGVIANDCEIGAVRQPIGLDHIVQDLLRGAPGQRGPGQRGVPQEGRLTAPGYAHEPTARTVQAPSVAVLDLDREESGWLALPGRCVDHVPIGSETGRFHETAAEGQAPETGDRTRPTLDDQVSEHAKTDQRQGRGRGQEPPPMRVGRCFGSGHPGRKQARPLGPPGHGPDRSHGRGALPPDDRLRWADPAIAASGEGL